MEVSVERHGIVSMPAWLGEKEEMSSKRGMQGRKAADVICVEGSGV